MPDRAAIRDWIREQTLVEVDDFADDKINNIIDQGIREISAKFDWPYLAESEQINLVQGTPAYNIPADMAKLRAIVHDGFQVRIREVAPTTVWEAEGGLPTDGSPKQFFIWAGQFVFRPIPDAAGTATVYYHRTPTLLTNDNQEPEFDSQFHLVLADYGSQIVWEREEEFEKAEVFGQRFSQGVERMARFYLNRGADSPMTFGERPNRVRRGPVFPWQTV